MQQVKAAVRKRDGYRCAECGKTTEQQGFTLDVHRLVPKSKYTLEGCVTLCRTCHGPKPKGKFGVDHGYGNLLLSVSINPDFKAALDAYIARSKPEVTIKAIVEAALADFLGAAGLWPPPPAPRKE